MSDAPQPEQQTSPARRPRRGRESLLIAALVTVALIAFIIVPLAAILARLEHRQGQAWQALVATATPHPTSTATAAPLAAFGESFLSFRYPPEWWVMAPAEAKAFLMMAVPGLKPEQYNYAGGVYTEGLDSCQGCAQIVVVVLRDASLTGKLSEAQYQGLRQASAQQMGARLLRHQRVELAGLPAVESMYLGADGRSQVWQFLVVPPEPGAAYLILCSSGRDSFAAFEPVFRRALDTLHIPGPVPTPVPTPVRTPTRAPTPTPVRTYKVQAGDVLGQIAKDLGVPLDALAEANGLVDPYIIHPGQVLTVPLGVR